MTNQPYY